MHPQPLLINLESHGLCVTRKALPQGNTWTLEKSNPAQHSPAFETLEALHDWLEIQITRAHLRRQSFVNVVKQSQACPIARDQLFRWALTQGAHDLQSNLDMVICGPYVQGVPRAAVQARASELIDYIWEVDSEWIFEKILAWNAATDADDLRCATSEGSSIAHVHVRL